jgi:hypothetical protein
MPAGALRIHRLSAHFSCSLLPPLSVFAQQLVFLLTIITTIPGFSVAMVICTSNEFKSTLNLLDWIVRRCHNMGNSA